MRVDNIIGDVFFQEIQEIKKGTRVTFTVTSNSSKHLNDIFNKVDFYRKHIVIKIIGTVQGVSFRHYACEKANELGITGFVRNEPDGSVYIEAEGEEFALDRFISWCHEGPPAAHVNNVIVTPGHIKNFKEFLVDRQLLA